MAKFVNSKVLDFGIDYIRLNCNKVVLVATYAITDTFATVNTAPLADVTGLLPADFVIASSGNNRTLTSASKTDTAANSSGGGAGNHIVYLNTTGSEILWATQDASGQAVVTGNPVTFPSLVYTSVQPV